MIKSQAIKSEFLVQLLKPSIYIVIVIFILLELFTFKSLYNELLFLIKENKMSGILSAVFPPAVNSCILMSTLTGGTIFTLLGGLSIRYDYSNKCVCMRASTYGYPKILQAKVLWGVLFSEVVSIISTVAGYLSQIYINNKQPEYAYKLMLSDIGLLFSKLLTLIIVLTVSYMVGMFIGNMIHHTGLTVILCLVVDQLLLAKSWLYTAYVYRQFSDSVLMTKTPTANLASYSSTVIALIIFAIVILTYLISTRVYRINAE